MNAPESIRTIMFALTGELPISGRSPGNPARSCRPKGIERCAVEELQTAGRDRRGTWHETLGGAIGKRDPRSAARLVDPDRDVHERHPRHDRGLAKCGSSQ